MTLQHSLIEQVKLITERDYALECYRVDDLMALFAPLIIQSYSEVASQESYAEGYDEGRRDGADDERDQIQDLIYDMKHSGNWDEETLREVIASI